MCRLIVSMILPWWQHSNHWANAIGRHIHHQRVKHGTSLIVTNVNKFLIDSHWHSHDCWHCSILQSSLPMNPDTYTFAGDAVTIIGFVGVVSTAIILFTAFTRYFNSPLRKWLLLSLFSARWFILRKWSPTSWKRAMVLIHWHARKSFRSSAKCVIICWMKVGLHRQIINDGP